MRTGRPQKVTDDALLTFVASFDEPTTMDVARHFGIDRSTAYVRLHSLDRAEWYWAERGNKRWLLTP